MNTAVQNIGREIRLHEISSERIPSLIGAHRTIDAWHHERIFRAAQPFINMLQEDEWLTIGDGGAECWILRGLGPLRAGRAGAGGSAGCSPIGRISHCPLAAQFLWRRGLSQEFSSPMNMRPGCPTDSFPIGMMNRNKNIIARARPAGRRRRSQRRLELR
jgi:hypothetical protein